MPFRTPIADYKFILEHVVGADQVYATERFGEVDRDIADAIVTEAARLCDDVLSPLQRPGDLHPAELVDGIVRTSPGFADGYKAVADGGWVGMAASQDRGGMGLPMVLATAVNDMMAGACLSLQLNPLMTQGQIEALESHADERVKDIFLPKLISGEWCGTMNLTEPQAGSDVGALRSKAEPNDDGSYSVSGQKIFISWGDNDFSANVCHLVLARLPDSAPGTKGISLFMVPKRLPDDNGEAGAANSLRVVSLEHKMGLHGSPTAVMEFDHAKGWLVGEPNGGLAAMFTMMNNARLGVGVQGIGTAEGAYQHALSYARERKQGRAAGTGAIVEHADVRRMLATMRTQIFAARSIALANAVAIDLAHATGSAAWSARAALLTPISKAYGTEVGIEVADLGIQVHGGMGFIEETGAAQYLRDVRVTAIYEGTNGIQAMDLVGRKMLDAGEAALALLDEIEAEVESTRTDLPDLAEVVWQSCESLREATEWMVARDAVDRFAGSMPYLRAFGQVLGAHFHLKAARAQPGGPRERLAKFFIKRLLPMHAAHLAHAMEGSEDLMNIQPDDLSA